MQTEKIKLREKLPETTRINKLFVFGILIILSIIVIFSLVSSLRAPSNNKDEHSHEMINNDTSAIEGLKRLPESYRDRQAIEKYLGDLQTQDRLRAEFEALKQHQRLLQKKVDALSTHGRVQPVSQQVQQARTSGLFFPGNAPTQEKTLAATEVKGTNAGIKDNDYKYLSAYEKQNMQRQKLKFLQEAEEDDLEIYNKHNLMKPLSPFELQAGTVIPAVLLTGINTSLPGQVVALASKDIYDSVTGQYLLIPKGSKILGAYDSFIAYGQERILVAFNRIIRPDGSSISLSKFSGTDSYGQIGLQGSINNHWGRVLSAAALSTLLSIGTGIASDSISDGNTYYRGATQNVLLGAAGNLSQTGRALVDLAVNIQPTLTLPPGYVFNILVNKDMILEPYENQL